MLWSISYRMTKGAPLEGTAIAERSAHLAWVAWSTPRYWSNGEIVEYDYYSAEAHPIPIGEVFDVSTAQIK